MGIHSNDPEWWDNQRPSARAYNEAGHGGRKSIRMDVFKGTEKLGAVVLRADEAAQEITLSIEQRHKA